MFQNFCLTHCRALTLPGWQALTKNAVTKYSRKLMGRDKDKELTQQVPSQAKENQIGEKLMKFITNQIRVR